jgi:hypothetical protein
VRTATGAARRRASAAPAASPVSSSASALALLPRGDLCGKARQCLLLFEAAGTLQLAQGGGAVAAHQLERGCRRGGLGDGSFGAVGRARASIWSTRCRASLATETEQDRHGERLLLQQIADRRQTFERLRRLVRDAQRLLQAPLQHEPPDRIWLARAVPHASPRCRKASSARPLASPSPRCHRCSARWPRS